MQIIHLKQEEEEAIMKKLFQDKLLKRQICIYEDCRQAMVVRYDWTSNSHYIYAKVALKSAFHFAIPAFLHIKPSFLSLR